MRDETIVYSTGLGGSNNLHDLQVRKELHEERKVMEDFLFLEPISLEEEYYFDQQHLDYDDDFQLACGCEIGDCTCEEDMQKYDDNCEAYEDSKRERLAEQQEY